MTSDDLLARLLDLAARRFGRRREELHADQDFFDALGIDSYRALELLTELEHAFGVEVPDWELEGVRTFGALAEVLRRRL
ncbi:MAG: acyl carrier protein [Myxococcota bacterium]|nr:acyl carrier protein [Myxococcota bacterium]MDW8363925.1 acyl carrier protein [Myxococcales bacterium]